MRAVLLCAIVGLLACAGGSFAQAPADTPAPETAQPAADVGLPEPLAEDGPPTRVWVCADYLLWSIPGQRLPALVGTIPTESAELVQTLPDSTITPLVGDGAGRFGTSVLSGVRLEAGLWLDAGQQFALEAGFFQLQQGRQGVALQSAADIPLGVVYRDPAAGQAVLIMDAVPGLRTGAVVVEMSNRLWGAEANALARLPLPEFPGQFSVLAGFRHLQFDEGLDVGSASAAVPGGHLPCG